MADISGGLGERADPPQPVELEAVTTWHMVQPAMRVVEIARLEAKRRNHRRNVQISNPVTGGILELNVSHEGLPPAEHPSPSHERSRVAQGSSKRSERDRLFYGTRRP